jgi:poly(3-hydroxybutyrate) depolymerase
MPFCALLEFARSDLDRSEIDARPDLFVVAPLSGHFAVLLRDLVVGLVPFFRVYVTDWINVRHIPLREGSLGLDGNISYVTEMTRCLRPRPIVIGLCQGGVPALASAALLAARHDAQTPSALILMGAPVNPLANPTRVVRLIRERSLSWFEANVISTVEENYLGRGRRVYPAYLQLAALWTYLSRRVNEGGELAAKLLYDDGSDPWQFPFMDLFTSIMDLDARFFLENAKNVFHDCCLASGTLHCHGERVDPRALRNTALFTIEGEKDDIAAPGQTSAAHDVCESVPPHLRRRLIIPDSGHFSLFHGQTYRSAVLPAICEFVAATAKDVQLDASIAA